MADNAQMMAHVDIAMSLRTVPTETRRIGHVGIAAVSANEALALVNDAVRRGDHLKLAFANAHVINLAAADAVFRDALRRCLVLPDGIGVDLGSRLLHGEAFPENLNGTDFTPALLSGVDRPCSVVLIGARPGVAERAAAHLQALSPRHACTVLSDGFFTADAERGLLDRLEALRPDILLVAFGNPRQEIWIADRIDARHCGVAIGVGALFDFLAGEAPRAPAVIRHMRLEWVWRLAHEPARLWRRYVLGNPAFLARMVFQKLAGRP